MISALPFKFPLPLKQQPRLAITRPVKDKAVLQKLLKLVQLGAIQETTEEPYFIPMFGVPKKNGTIRLVLDFRKCNSCIQHQPFLLVNCEFSLVAVRPYTIGSALDLANVYLQVPLHPSLWRYMGVLVGGDSFSIRIFHLGITTVRMNY